MFLQPITSRRNPLVKRLRDLATRQGREREGRVLLEGTHLLDEVIRLRSDLYDLIATPSWIQKHGALVASLPIGSTIQPVSNEVLEAALTTASPDGVACLFPLSGLPTPPASPSYLLALDRIQDPGNLGTILRTALAADVDVVLLGSGADPLSPKVLRSSAGTLLQLPHERFGPGEHDAILLLEHQLSLLARCGHQVVATLVPGASGPLTPIPYWDLDWTRKTVLVLGTEGAGLHPRLQAQCTHAVTLPHSERVQSLNVAACAVPLLLERRRATMTATTQQPR